MPKKNRVQFDLSDSAHARLKSLKSRMECSGGAQVIIAGMSILEYILDERAKGNRFVLQAPNGDVIREVVFLGLREEGVKNE